MATNSMNQRIAELATSQHGVVHLDQLRRLGLCTSAVSKRARVGDLHRIHPCVYAVGHGALSREGAMLAAAMSVGRDAVVSHASALETWGIRPSRSAIVDVSVGRRHRHLPGVRVHGSRRLPSDETTVRAGTPVTTIARTLVDLGMVLTAPQLANVMHEAAFRRRLNMRALLQVMRRHRTSVGHPVVAEALELHRSGSAGTKSGLESRLYGAVRRARLVRPTPNAKVRAGTELIEVDLLWAELRLCVEVDGSGHERARTRREDAARDVLLRAAGYEVVRIPGRIVRNDLALAVRTVAEAIDARMSDAWNDRRP